LNGTNSFHYLNESHNLSGHQRELDILNYLAGQEAGVPSLYTAEGGTTLARQVSQRGEDELGRSANRRLREKRKGQPRRRAAAPPLDTAFFLRRAKLVS
jgi:hypothetical protein